MSQRDYNRVYTYGRLIAQVLQDGQHDGIAIDVLPSCEIAVNSRLLVCGVALRWLTGDLCFGIMKKSFMQNEKDRMIRVQELADKAGLTVRQQELRWGW
jgi:hypothetical protein